MSKLMSRISRWLYDPFGKEQIRKHENVIEAIRQTTVRAHETTTTLVNVQESKFPVGHMIGAKNQRASSRRARRN